MKSEIAHLLGIAGIVLGRESPEVIAEYTLEMFVPRWTRANVAAPSAAGTGGMHP